MIFTTFSTTTALPMTAVGAVSALGIFPAQNDIAGSDTFVAQTLGGNFVSGVPLSPAGDLVAGARRFAQEPPVHAGLFSTRAGSSAVEAGVGVGAAVGSMRSALVSGGIFAAGEDDKSKDAPPPEARPESPETVNTGDAAPRLTPTGTLAGIHADVVRVREAALNELGDEQLAVAPVQPEITPPHVFIHAEYLRYLDLLSRDEDSRPYKMVADLPFALVAWKTRWIIGEWFNLTKEERSALNPQSIYKVPEELFIEQFTSAAASAPRGAQDAQEIVPPYTLAHIEIARYMGLFSNPDGSLYQLAKDLSFPVMVQYTNLVVSKWFEMSFEERKAIDPNNPDQVEETWFTIAFAGLLEDRGVTSAAADAVAPQSAQEIVPQYTLIEAETRKFLVLASNSESPVYEIMQMFAPEIREAKAREAVERWFSLSVEGRRLWNEDIHHVPANWFVNHLSPLAGEPAKAE